MSAVEAAVVAVGVAVVVDEVVAGELAVSWEKLAVSEP